MAAAGAADAAAAAAAAAAGGAAVCRPREEKTSFETYSSTRCNYLQIKTCRRRRVKLISRYRSSTEKGLAGGAIPAIIIARSDFDTAIFFVKF